jgi:type 1 glutamine amidotransferase
VGLAQQNRERATLNQCNVRFMRLLALILAAACLSAAPGHGKRIVLIAGDQEYRSEESMPALAKILEKHHGFQCTVLYSVNRQTGRIDPATMDNIPGLQALRQADLMILFARMLDLPDDQMREILDYTESGRPMIGIRTSTHPFNFEKHQDSLYAKYSWRSKDPPGGYGRLVFGETWIAHYGEHQKESTRGVIAPGVEHHPILKGVHHIWGASDVYEITSLAGDSHPLVTGQVLSSMDPSSPPNTAKKLMPVAWTKSYKNAHVFATTMGHALDFTNEGFRRMIINACYWSLRMEKQISAKSNVDFVSDYNPNPIGFGKQKTDLGTPHP